MWGRSHTPRRNEQSVNRSLKGSIAFPRSMNSHSGRLWPSEWNPSQLGPLGLRGGHPIQPTRRGAVGPHEDVAVTKQSSLRPMCERNKSCGSATVGRPPRQTPSAWDAAALERNSDEGHLRQGLELCLRRRTRLLRVAATTRGTGAACTSPTTASPSVSLHSHGSLRGSLRVSLLRGAGRRREVGAAAEHRTPR